MNTIPAEVLMVNLLNSMTANFKTLMGAAPLFNMNNEYKGVSDSMGSDYLHTLAFKFIKETNLNFEEELVMNVIFENVIDMDIMYDVLRNIPVVLNRKKGEKYQHILKPFLTRGIFKNFRSENCESTVKFLFRLYNHIQFLYETSDNVNGIRIHFWVFYAIIELCFQAYKSSVVFRTEAFKMILMHKVLEAKNSKICKVLSGETKWRMESLLTRVYEGLC